MQPDPTTIRIGTTDAVLYATLAYARSFLGQHERDRRIQAAFVDGIPEYYQWAQPPDMHGEPPDWCASFVSHCIRGGLGLPDTWRDRIYVASGSRPFAPKDHDHPFERWLVNVSQITSWADRLPQMRWLDQPSPGCIFVEYTRGAPGHVGLVSAANEDAFRTIEGNYRDQVSSRLIPLREGRPGGKSYRFICWWTGVNFDAVRGV